MIPQFWAVPSEKFDNYNTSTQVSPSEFDEGETTCSLGFGARVKQVELNGSPTDRVAGNGGVQKSLSHVPSVGTNGNASNRRLSFKAQAEQNHY